MIGTTRSRVSFFMNKFRKLGFIDYSGGGGLEVHSQSFEIEIVAGRRFIAAFRGPPMALTNN